MYMHIYIYIYVCAAHLCAAECLPKRAEYSNNDEGTPLTQQPPHILPFLLLLPLLLQMAEILSLNPNMSLAQKRSFIRRFIKNSARPPPEYLKVLEMS